MPRLYNKPSHTQSSPPSSSMFPPHMICMLLCFHPTRYTCLNSSVTFEQMGSDRIHTMTGSMAISSQLRCECLGVCSQSQTQSQTKSWTQSWTQSLPNCHFPGKSPGLQVHDGFISLSDRPRIILEIDLKDSLLYVGDNSELYT